MVDERTRGGMDGGGFDGEAVRRVGRGREDGLAGNRYHHTR